MCTKDATGGGRAAAAVGVGGSGQNTVSRRTGGHINRAVVQSER